MGSSCSTGTTLARHADLRQRGARTGARDHRGVTRQRGQCGGIAAFRQHAGTQEIRRQSHRHTGTAGDQRVVFGRLADRDQMRVAHRIDDGVAAALLLQRGHRLSDRDGSLLDDGIGNEAHRAIGLPRQHAHQVGVGHRRQRMVLHAALVEQSAADEQIALIDAARIRRECRTGKREAAAECGDQRIGDGADVAGVGAVEGGAVLEEELPAAGRAQPGECGKAFIDRLPHRRRARLQGDDNRIGVGHGIVRAAARR